MPASTIQIFLPDGNPRGLRLAEITSRTVQILAFPRADFKTKATKRAELNEVAVYFLVGRNAESAEPMVYVGQAEEAGRRITQHDAKKEWWEVALVAVSKTGHFTNVHVKYLEWFCHEAIEKAGRYSLDNDQTPSRPHVSESLEADLAGDFDTIRTLSGTLGYALFDELAKTESPNSIVVLRSRDADARAVYGEDGLVVLAGSRGPAELTESAHGGFVETGRDRLLESGVLRRDGTDVVFTRDFAFGTPSNAAAMVTGSHRNGWRDWKYADGRTLSDVHR